MAIFESKVITALGRTKLKYLDGGVQEETIESIQKQVSEIY